MIRPNLQSGYALFTSIMLTGTLIIIAYATTNFALKQLLLSTSGADSHLAFYVADSGVECAMYWDVKNGPTSAFDSSAPTSSITCGGQSNAVTSTGGGSETIWLDDGSALPSGFSPSSDGGDSWTWVGANPSPQSGTSAHQSNDTSGEHQHYFTGTSFPVATGDILIAYIYINPASPPSEVMLQWNSGGSWEHRAYWGSDSIGWGSPGTASRYYRGVLPMPGGWVALQVPASLVGLEGQTVNGIAFTLFNGQATWDHVGKSSAGSGGGISTFQIPVGSSCAIVTVTKTGTNTTIESKGYNTCSGGNRLERAIRITY